MLRAIMAKSIFGLSMATDVRLLPRGASLISIRHALQVHEFLVIRAIVPHHEQHRNLVVRRSP